MSVGTRQQSRFPMHSRLRSASALAPAPVARSRGSLGLPLAPLSGRLVMRSQEEGSRAEPKILELLIEIQREQKAHGKLLGAQGRTLGQLAETVIRKLVGEQHGKQYSEPEVIRDLESLLRYLRYMHLRACPLSMVWQPDFEENLLVGLSQAGLWHRTMRVLVGAVIPAIQGKLKTAEGDTKDKLLAALSAADSVTASLEASRDVSPDVTTWSALEDPFRKLLAFAELLICLGYAPGKTKEKRWWNVFLDAFVMTGRELTAASSSFDRDAVKRCLRTGVAGKLVVPLLASSIEASDSSTPIQQVIALDCKGQLSSRHGLYHLEIAEIKSSRDGVHDGKKQVCRVAALVRRALSWALEVKDPQGFKTLAIINIPFSEPAAADDEVEEEAFDSVFEVTVRVVTV